MELARVLYLSVAFLTHGLLGYALVRSLTEADPRLGIVFGLAPDADFLFPAALEWPLVHRGLTHTPLFAAAIVLGAAAFTRDRAVGLAVALAIGSHLLLDALSPAGIDWLFPLRTSWSPGVAIHGLAATAVLWTVALGLLARRTDAFEALYRRRTAGREGPAGE